MKSKKSPLVKTTEDFAARTTVHGIGYVFDPSLNFIDRMFWLAVKILTIIKLKFSKSNHQVVSTFLVLAGYLTSQSLKEWKDEQVVKKSGFVFFPLLGNTFELFAKRLSLSLSSL